MLKRLILAIFAIALLAMAGTGCHTARGFGEDMESAGHKLQEKTQ